MMKVMHIVGARPNFMKIAPLHRELNRFPDKFAQVLVHTGQHYDERMSTVFFEELGMPEPDVYLGVGSGTHALQTARIMTAFEPVLQDHVPDIVVVVGDVNSTMACALVSAKLGVPVAHVEAGLRSFDRSMPEEINRIVTDHISDVLLVSEPSGEQNLRQEGIDSAKVHFVGNVMIDTLMQHRECAAERHVATGLGLEPRNYALLTLHRPSNVDCPQTLQRIVSALVQIQRDVPIVFPVHPRTLSRLTEFGLRDRLGSLDRILILEPQGYLEFLSLMADAAVVLTDSGGIQEETTILSVPCITLRDNTERPVTLTGGANVLVGSDPERIVAETRRALSGSTRDLPAPELWDGHAAGRIAKVLTGLQVSDCDA